ncbi:MAG: glycosyltransferase [Chlamydiae bacterium]|nr:glycosyltransferase [Chlamydiota bacterium]
MRKIIGPLFFLWLFPAFLLNADQTNDRPLKQKTVCLNMIVKDESKVIKRCLASVKKIIDYWVIVDTGSSDGTQNIIKEFMKDIPGELHERPWVNFGHNRNEALQLAKNKGDYVLFIDADEFLAFTDNFQMPKLDKDCYLIEIKEQNEMIFKRTFLINNSLNWHWEGVLHEDISCPQSQTFEVMSNVMDINMNDGHRSEDPKKYLKDAQMLEKELEKDPHNTRIVFYIGEAYCNAKEYLQALKYYEKRALMGGWDEEVFWSFYLIARIQEVLNLPQDIVINSYCKAFQSRPSRAEPLYCLGKYYNRINKPCLANIVLSYARLIQTPNDGIYIQPWIYNFGIEFERYISLYYMGKKQEAYDGLNKIFALKDLPLNIKNDFEREIEIYQIYNQNK